MFGDILLIFFTGISFLFPSLIHCLRGHTLVARPRVGPRNTHRSLSSVGKRKTPEVGKAGTSIDVPWDPLPSGSFDILPHTRCDGDS